MLPLVLETQYAHLTEAERAAAVRSIARVHQFVRAARTEKAILEMKAR